MKVALESQVTIPFDEFVALKKSRKCNLGVSSPLAEAISLGKVKTPTSRALKSTKTAFWLWTIVGYGPLIAGVYQSFTNVWWAFFPGLICSYVWWSINKSSNQKNILSLAEDDREFYEAIRAINGWAYELDDAEYSRLTGS